MPTKPVTEFRIPTSTLYSVAQELDGELDMSDEVRTGALDPCMVLMHHNIKYFCEEIKFYNIFPWIFLSATTLNHKIYKTCKLLCKSYSQSCSGVEKSMETCKYFNLTKIFFNVSSSSIKIKIRYSSLPDKKYTLPYRVE